MRSISDDRTSRAIIRDEALRLFAERGPDAVSVRQIAAAAGVSPGLVVHHFGSKDGLCAEVDRHVLATFEAMLGELTTVGGAGIADPATAGSPAEALLRHLPPDSPLSAYLGRLLLSGSEAASTLFRGLFELSRRTLEDLADAGLAVRGNDPEVRAAFLLINDLAVFLLRDRLADVLGTDPLAPTGIERWAPEVLTIYAGGLGATTDGGSTTRTTAAPPTEGTGDTR